MKEWFIDFFKDKDNIGEIVLIVIGIFLGLLIPAIGRFFNWLRKLIGTGIKKVITNSKNKLKEMKANRKENQTIKQIERMEIPVPDNFLNGKEGNPKYRKIFQMIDDGLIEAPPLYRLKKMLNDNPDILKNITTELPITRLPEIKQPFIKK